MSQGEFSIKIKPVIPRFAATVGAAAALAAPANAATRSPGIKRPDGCSTGTYYGVLTNYGNTFAQLGPEVTDYNGSGTPAQETLTSQASGTVSSTLSGNIGVSLNVAILDISSQLSISATLSVSVSVGNNFNINVPAHQYGHGEYGTWQNHSWVETYDMSGNCSSYDQQYANQYSDDGIGWNAWTGTS